MLTKFLNALGIQTKAQRDAELDHLLAAIRQVTAMRTYQTNIQPAVSVITSDEVPQRSKAKPTRPTVRRGADTDWNVVGYTTQSNFTSYDSGSSAGSSDCNSSPSSFSSSD